MGFIASCVEKQDHKAFKDWVLAGSLGIRNPDFDLSIRFDGQVLTYLGSSTAPDRKYPLGCLQDALLGAYVVMLEDAGILQLRDTIGSFVPALMPKTAPGSRICFADLVSHSSGAWLGRAAERKTERVGWDAICDYLTELGLEFEPGTLVTHSLIERMMLFHALERLKGPGLYDALNRALFGPDTPVAFIPFPESFGLGICELHGSIEDLMLFLDRAGRSSWYRRLAAGEHARAIVARPTGKPWVARAAGLGMVRYENGLWGQDANNYQSSHLGLRLSPSCGTAVLGRFATAFERDSVLSRVCCDLLELPPSDNDRIVGHLAGLPIEDITGRYTGILGNSAFLEIEGGRFTVRTHAEDGIVMSPRLGEDGLLTMRHPFAGLWIEPVLLPGSNAIGLRTGQDVLVKYD